VDANHDFVGVLSNVGRQLWRVFERVTLKKRSAGSPFPCSARKTMNAAGSPGAA